MHKEAPLVSICVVTYNHEKYIEQCIDSVLNQKTNFEFEIVLGEDDSTDGTRAICKSYADKYPGKIRLFLRSREDVIYINGNPTGRFNFVENLKSARGKYIALCEGDDFWTDPLKLQKQVDYLEANQNDILSCHNSNVVNSKGELIRIFNESDTPVITDTTYILQNWWYIPTASVVFRNNLNIPNWFSTVLNGDYALYLIITANGGLIHYDKEIRSSYRQHSEGLSNVFKKEFVYDHSMIRINEHFNSYSNKKYEKICLYNIEFYSLRILKNSKILSREFWVVMFNLLWIKKEINGGFYKVMKDRLFKR